MQSIGVCDGTTNDSPPETSVTDVVAASDTRDAAAVGCVGSDGWVPVPSQWNFDVKPRVATIAGSFAVDGLEGPLMVWLDQITGLLPALSLRWAPYADTLLQLPMLLRGPKAGGAEVVVLLLRLEDLCIVHPESRHAPVTKKKSKSGVSGAGNCIAESVGEESPRTAEEIDREFREKYGCARLDDAEAQLIEAVETLDRLLHDASAADVAVHLIIFPPPPSHVGQHTHEWAHAAVVAERWLHDRIIANQGRVTVTRSQEILDLLPAHAQWYDRRMDRLAHAPFTAAVFHAAAQVCARALHRLIFQSAPKVAVLDCDNTLWGGAVAELGTAGVAITAPYLALQRFFVELHHRGTLICLCSRNNQAHDVLRVWRDRGEEMELKLEHVVAHWVSMRSKSQGLQHLAESLCLGIDSLVLVDDSATECAEVSASLPQVAVVQLPRDPNLYGRFMGACWLFDPAFGGAGSRTTEVDATRTALYRQVAQRSEAFGGFEGDLPAWVASLGIAISFDPVGPKSVDRAAQLTERTSQMNSCKRPVAAATLLQRCADGPTLDLMHVTVRDRFGDHGIVGLLVVSSAIPEALQVTDAATEKALDVETFLLSCRSLHLGVEHAMMRHLASLATDRGLDVIRIQWQPSERNDAACHFFSRIPGATFVEVEEAVEVTTTCTEASHELSEVVLQDVEEAPQKGSPPRQDVLLAFMTPELEGLSKRDRRRELRRRAREAQKPALAEARREKRKARRAESQEVAARVEQVSQHRPFGDKPAAGYVRVPVASASVLSVSISGGPDKQKQALERFQRTSGTEAASDMCRCVRVTPGHKPVALHHETTLSLGIGLSCLPNSVHDYVTGASDTPVERMLGGRPSEGEPLEETHVGESTLETFREDCAKREQARDVVKVMIQNENPTDYDHVDHLRRDTVN
eukprot:m.22916 g.22916  ORF g.22916 m.22916 type:complete len:918 (+) comp5885_c0_seq1:93-2846(+)